MPDETITSKAAPEDKIYLMPQDIVDLISQAEQGLIDWDFVIDEATHAAKEGRIAILTNIA